MYKGATLICGVAPGGKQMGDPLQHAKSSAVTFGGLADDYIRIHMIMDSSKLFLADWRHRALLHNTFGIHLFETLLGPSFMRPSDGVAVCTRTVVSQHIMEDLKAIPTPGEFLREMPLRPWMAGISPSNKKRMQEMTIDGNPSEAMEGKVCTGGVVWSLATSYEPPSIPGCHVTAYLVQYTDELRRVAEFNTDTKLWYDTYTKTVINPPLYWAPMPLGPIS